MKLSGLQRDGLLIGKLVPLIGAFGLGDQLKPALVQLGRGLRDCCL